MSSPSLSPTTFDRDTAVVPLPGGNGKGADRFAATISRDWWVAAGPNGGLVAALVVRAAEAAVARPGGGPAGSQSFPRTVTVHYLAPPEEGPAELEVTSEKAGRSVAFVSVRLSQGGRPRATALVALANDRPAGAAGNFAFEARPRVPPPDQCPRLAADGGSSTIRDRWDTRWAFGSLPAAEGVAPAGDHPVETGGWIRLTEPRPIDAAVLVAMADGWVPPLLTRPDLGPSLVPTVELTVHLRDRAALAHLGGDDWCLVRFRSSTAQEGFVEEDGWIWSADGRLLAQSRQLAVLATPPPGYTMSSLRLEPRT